MSHSARSTNPGNNPCVAARYVTHARHYRHVPPEAIAYFYLHHRLKALTGREPSLTDISEYYTQTTEKQRFAIISADLDEQEDMDQEFFYCPRATQLGTEE